MKSKTITSKVQTRSSGKVDGIFTTTVTEHKGVEDVAAAMDRMASDSKDPNLDYVLSKLDRFESAGPIEAAQHGVDKMSDLPRGSLHSTLYFAQDVVRNCGLVRRYLKQEKWMLALGRMADAGSAWSKWRLAMIEADYTRGFRQVPETDNIKIDSILKDWTMVQSEQGLKKTPTDQIIADKYGLTRERIGQIRRKYGKPKI